MPTKALRTILCLLFTIAYTLCLTPLLFGQTSMQRAAIAPTPHVAASAPDEQTLLRNVRGEIEFLASDALGGRGGETRDEAIAAAYVASMFRQFGLEPGGDAGGYIQDVPLQSQHFAAPPFLRVTSASGSAPQKGTAWEWTHGKDMAILRYSARGTAGHLMKQPKDASAEKGAAVLVTLTEDKKGVREQLMAPCMAGASIVLVDFAEQLRRRYESAGKELPQVGPEAAALGPACSIVLLGEQASKDFAALPEGADVQIEGKLVPDESRHTRNVIGVLRGESDDAIVLGAHIDHLGTDPKLKGDQIYNGADDDASGVSMMLEIARALAAEGKPRRTIYFAGFGDEEKGGLGSGYFLTHPPVPLEKMVAEIEFEMVGRPDKAVGKDQLWLTGWERTDLGPELAKHGAALVGDPHPTEMFFQRSDNYGFAKRGVVAQTVSSFGLHKDYHQPSDDVAHMDFDHLAHAAATMMKSMEWFANSNFRPQWVAGGKP